MKTYLNRRALVSISIFLMLLVIAVTSVLMFSQRYNNTTATVHSIIGFAFLALAIWHISHNFLPLKKYLHPNNIFSTKKYGVAPHLATAFCCTLVVLTAIEITPFRNFHNWGTTLRITSNYTTTKTEALKYDIFNFDLEAKGRNFTVELRKGDEFHWPQYAIWLEDLDGSLIQPIFVTQSVASNTFKNSVWLKSDNRVLESNPFSNKKFIFESLFGEHYDGNANNNRIRKESLPVFLHKLKQDNNSDRLLGDREKAILDGNTGATITDHFILRRKLSHLENSEYNVFLEINQSFDFNHYYTSHKFPDDQIYSGDGFSAQPSIIYSAQIDFNDTNKIVSMNPVGHGHHSGKNGDIDPDMHNLTTALNIIDRVIIDLR